MTEIENLGGLPWNWMFIILTMFLLFISIKINTELANSDINTTQQTIRNYNYYMTIYSSVLLTTWVVYKLTRSFSCDVKKPSNLTFFSQMLMFVVSVTSIVLYSMMLNSEEIKLVSSTNVKSWIVSGLIVNIFIVLYILYNLYNYFKTHSKSSSSPKESSSSSAKYSKDSKDFKDSKDSRDIKRVTYEY